MDLRTAFEQIASSFPNSSGVTGDNDAGFEVAWTGATVPAGVRSYGKQVVVFLAEAESEVVSVSAATELLSGIFNDVYVAVLGFKNDALIRCYIAPANNIGAGLNSPTHVYLGPIATPVDELRIRSWSGALDA
ncbi:MAG: hypothetical protein WDM79_05550 [Terricaulis sp.]